MTRTEDRRSGGVRRGAERGGATLFAVACVGLLLVIGAALGVVAAIVVAHRTAQAAADLAALAAAAEAGAGGDACGRGASVARANGAVLTQCVVAGSEVVVQAEVAGPRWLGWSGDLVGRARAGPGDLPDDTSPDDTLPP